MTRLFSDGISNSHFPVVVLILLLCLTVWCPTELQFPSSTYLPISSFLATLLSTTLAILHWDIAAVPSCPPSFSSVCWQGTPGWSICWPCGGHKYLAAALAGYTLSAVGQKWQRALGSQRWWNAGWQSAGQSTGWPKGQRWGRWQWRELSAPAIINAKHLTFDHVNTVMIQQSLSVKDQS